MGMVEENKKSKKKVVRFPDGKEITPTTTVGVSLAKKLQTILITRVRTLLEEGYSLRGIEDRMTAFAESAKDPDYKISHSEIHKVVQGTRGKVPPSDLILIKRLRALGVDVPEILRELSPEEAAIFLAYVTEHKDEYNTLARAILGRGKYYRRLQNFLAEMRQDMNEEEQKP